MNLKQVPAVVLAALASIELLSICRRLFTFGDPLQNGDMILIGVLAILAWVVFNRPGLPRDQ